MFVIESDKESPKIDIITNKYIYLSEIALKGLCNKFAIQVYWKADAYVMATQIIPQNLLAEGFLQSFYHKLAPNEKKILKYIVNYSGENIEKDIKKKFNYSIALMTKKSITIYTWWLELFINDGEFEPVYQEIFLRFLSEDRDRKGVKQKRGTKKVKSYKVINSCASLKGIVIHKMDMNRQIYPKGLIEYKAQDVLKAVKVLYALAQDSKINITQKGTINLRNERVLDEKMPKNYNYRWLIVFLTNNEYLSFTKSREPTMKFHQLMSKDDSSIVETLFDIYKNLQKIEELMFMEFYHPTSKHKSVKILREMALKLISQENPALWINVDYIVDKIKIDAKTLALVTDGYDYAYGFYGNSFKISHNKIEHLKVVVRYFLRNFVAMMNHFGLCDIAFIDEVLYHKEDVGVLKRYELDSGTNTLEYYKLSELGKHILGLSSNFKNTNSYKLILNEYALEIKVENANDLSTILLEKITTKTAKDKYKTDVKTFIKSIDSKIEYETIVNTFMKNSKTVSQNWKRFFDLLESRVKSASIVSNNAVLLKIKNDKEILKLIATNEKLQEKILKADKFHIVVFEKDLNFVKKVFKEFGIIL